MRGVLLSLLLSLSALPAFAQPAAPPAETKVDASRGGVTISSGVNSLTIGARGQFRWTVDDREQFDGDTVGPGVGHEDGPLSGFDFTRLRVALSGGVWRAWLRYSFQFEMSRGPGESGSRIKDATLEIRPVGKHYRVQFGQLKVPFGLQQITSSGRLQFVDRAITDLKFNPARDQGVMFGGTNATRKFGYDLGVFNGSGEATRQNNRSQLWVGRAYVNPFGVYTPNESATDPPPKPVLHVGVAVRGGKPIRGRSTAGVIENADNETALGLELAYKSPRVFATAEQFWMTDEQRVPTPGPDISSRGFHAQAGYMLKPKTTEIGLLVAHINADTDVDDAGLSEVRGVFGYYFQGHNLKVQADIGQLGYGSKFASLSSRARLGLPALGTRLVSGEALSDTQVRVQLQLAF